MHKLLVAVMLLCGTVAHAEEWNETRFKGLVSNLQWLSVNTTPETFAGTVVMSFGATVPSGTSVVTMPAPVVLLDKKLRAAVQYYREKEAVARLQHEEVKQLSATSKAALAAEVLAPANASREEKEAIKAKLEKVQTEIGAVAVEDKLSP